MTTEEAIEAARHHADAAFEALMRDHPIGNADRHKQLRIAYVRASQEHLDLVETANHERYRLVEPPLMRHVPGRQER